jgi:hypothetical protein
MLGVPKYTVNTFSVSVRAHLPPAAHLGILDLAPLFCVIFEVIIPVIKIGGLFT